MPRWTVRCLKTLDKAVADEGVNAGRGEQRLLRRQAGMGQRPQHDQRDHRSRQAE